MSSSESDKTQRRFFRVAVDFPVILIVPGHELVLPANALDLSGGGMRVATRTDLPSGQSIVLRFTLPGTQSEKLVHGLVVLSFYDAAKKQYAHGVAFTQYSRADQAEISAYVARHKVSPGL